MKRAAIYTRVSTATRGHYGDRLAHDQNPAVQEAPLRDLATARGRRNRSVNFIASVYGLPR